MNILVTGANGQLGKCIYDQVEKRQTKNNYIYTDVIDGDTVDYIVDSTDEDEVGRFVKENDINVIINCAAYTNVDKAENDYENAEAVNAFAPLYLATAARENGALLIHISTDYVFDGCNYKPYNEADVTNSHPISTYGKTKLMGEEYIAGSGCKYLIFRTAWLYSEYGNNFVKTMYKLIKEKDEIDVVNDQIGTPTYAGNLAKFIVDICECTTPLEGKETIPLLQNGTYHFTDEGVASWYDFSYKIRNAMYTRWVTGKTKTTISGLATVKGVTTKEYGSKTKRPYYSVLDKTKLKTDFKGLYSPLHWFEGVEHVVEILRNNDLDN